MAAILGAVRSTRLSQHPEAWKRATECLRSRDAHGAMHVVNRGSFQVVLLSPNVSNLFQSDEMIVIIDGSVDNAIELASSLQPVDQPKLTSPAEAVAALYAQGGTASFGAFVGDFAAVIVDVKANEALLLRDRFGSRPLYYTKLDSGWAFSSELKGLTPLLPSRTIDPRGTAESIWYRWHAGAHTLIGGVSSVMPTCYVRLSDQSLPEETPYYSLRFTPIESEPDFRYWENRLHHELTAYFARLQGQYQDIGIFLSGGVDSALLAHYAVQSGFRRCIAFTAHSEGNNPEAKAASAIAHRLKIPLYSVNVHDEFVSSFLPSLIWRLEGIPRHYNSFAIDRLCHSARSHVTAVVHGEGADALFGPGECILLRRFAKKSQRLRLIPKAIRNVISDGLLATRRPGRVRRIAEYLRSTPAEYLLTIDRIDHTSQGARLFSQATDQVQIDAHCLQLFDDPVLPLTERFQKLHLYTFCHSHLTYLDRLSASANLRIHMPFMSPGVVSLATSLPSAFKMNGRISKPVVKSLAARWFPDDWIYRPKFGFPTPNARWVSKLAAKWGRLLQRGLAAESNVLTDNILDSLNSTRDLESIWTALCLEMFLRLFLNDDPGKSLEIMNAWQEDDS